MALYQGEDISIGFTGEGLVNLDASKFVVLIASRTNNDEVYTLQGKDFNKIGEVYSCIIPNNVTKNMNGYYDLEFLLEDTSYPAKRSIFTKEDALFINKSRIKDVKIEY